MTINEVLTEVDELKPNQYQDETKIRWLSILEGKIVDEIFKTHVLAEKIEFTGYSINDINSELLVPDTYADLYRYYLYAMIDQNNGEMNRYAGSMQAFNQAYKDFANYYNRNNLPIADTLKLWR